MDELRSTDFLEKHMMSNNLLLHNSIVFNDGQKAAQVLPRLIDVIPEAKINLVIHYLRSDEIESASDLIDDLEPKSPHEFILKGIVNTCIGQMKGDLMAIRDAQKYFQHVGVSSSECDTIPGRQCMASCFFLLKQFKDALVYLTSIKNYLGKKVYLLIICSINIIEYITLKFFVPPSLLQVTTITSIGIMGYL